MKNPFFDWSTALKLFNHDQCQYVGYVNSFLTIRVFVTVLGNEINPISKAQDQLLENKVAKSGEKPFIIKCILL